MSSATLEERIDEMKGKETVVMINDLHVPFQDKKTLEPVYQCIRDIKPDVLILGGDVCDFYTISKFDHDPRRKLTLKDETDEVKKELKKIRELTKGKIVYIEGNHEERAQKYIIRNAKELIWFDGWKLPELLELDKLNIKYIPRRWYEYKGVLYSHIDKSNKFGGYSAKNLGLDHLTDLIHTHSHHTGKIRHGKMTFYDNGCLCEPQADYLESPSLWTQAFMVVNYIDGKPYFHQVDIKEHKFVYDGKLYRPRRK